MFYRYQSQFARTRKCKNDNTTATYARVESIDTTPPPPHIIRIIPCNSLCTLYVSTTRTLTIIFSKEQRGKKGFVRLLKLKTFKAVSTIEQKL